MSKGNRCVKVTFSVVGTRTLEYMINEDKEYQGKIYFTFDKEKATNENTIYVGFKEDYLDLVNSESTIRLTDRILEYIEKEYSEYAKEPVHLFIGIADKTLQNFVQSLLYEVIMANVVKTFNVDDVALAPVQVSKNVLAIYEAESGAYRLYATNGFTVLDERHIPAGTRGGLVQNPNNLSGESTWVAEGVKVDAVSILENACILSTNKDVIVNVANSIVLNSILRLSEEVNGSIVNESLMTCANITGCGLVKAVKRTLSSYDNSIIFNTDRFFDITPDASVHGFIVSPNHPFEVSTRRTSSKYYYVGIDGKYYIRDEMFNREVLDKVVALDDNIASSSLENVVVVSNEHVLRRTIQGRSCYLPLVYYFNSYGEEVIPFSVEGVGSEEGTIVVGYCTNGKVNINRGYFFSSNGVKPAPRAIKLSKVGNHQFFGLKGIKNDNSKRWNIRQVKNVVCTKEVFELSI